VNFAWEVNPDAGMLAAPSEGDIVHLKLIDTYEYLVKCIVSSTSTGKIEGTVHAVLDWKDQVNIVEANVLELVGKFIEFTPLSVQKVIPHA